MLEQVAGCTPGLTGFVAKCYGERPAVVFFPMESGLRPVLMRARDGYESKGVEAYTYHDDSIVAAHDVTPGTMGGVPFVERELTRRGIHFNPGETVASASPGQVPMPVEISRVAEVGVRIADEGGIKVVGVPVGTDECQMESALGVVRDGSAGTLARVLPRVPDKQTANLISTSAMVQRRAHLERVMGPKLSPPARRRADNGAMWVLENLLELS